MRKHPQVIGGAAGAALLGFDGFRGLDWPPLWCAPHTARPGAGLHRTRGWLPPLLVGDDLVAHPAVLLRQLGLPGQDLRRRGDQLGPLDRIELAVEHALRLGVVTLADLRWRGGGSPGARLLAAVLANRGDEPPTESYAETRCVQRLREWGRSCWRQIPVVDRGRRVHRVDLVVPSPWCRGRPPHVTPESGLVIEVDSREFHGQRFEEDHQRQSVYDRLGLHWISLTPNQIEHHALRSRQAVDGAMRRAGWG